METKLTWCISTHNNYDYLKLVVESIRRNAFYKNSPIIVHAENCTDGTDEWISQQADITSLIDHHSDKPKGIGGGANFAIASVKTPLFSLIHSDMIISRNYDAPLVEEVETSDKPLVACAWRAEPNIWNQPDRLGTTMVPVDTTNGFGMYHHDFQVDQFEAWADDFVKQPPIKFRKIEGVSYIMRKSDWDYVGGNSPEYSPSSFEDHQLSVRMQCENYNFVVTSKAIVWHFGSRGSIFMGQSDKLQGRSQRQIECETRNHKTWVAEWGCSPQYDSVGFIKVSDDMKERYKQNKSLYLGGKL